MLKNNLCFSHKIFFFLLQKLILKEELFWSTQKAKKKKKKCYFFFHNPYTSLPNECNIQTSTEISCCILGLPGGDERRGSGLKSGGFIFNQRAWAGRYPDSPWTQPRNHSCGEGTVCSSYCAKTSSVYFTEIFPLCKEQLSVVAGSRVC